VITYEGRVARLRVLQRDRRRIVDSFGLENALRRTMGLGPRYHGRNPDKQTIGAPWYYNQGEWQGVVSVQATYHW
jgi:hypothetical protein